MNNIVVYLSPDIKSAAREKIAEILRIRQIDITDDMNTATVVITSPNQISGPFMSLEELTTTMVEKNQQDVFILMEHNKIPDITQILNKPKNYKIIPNKTFKQFNQIKQKQIFNRTNCK